MPLSEHEQRILEEIERRLVADDPKFARDVSTGTAQGKSLKRVKRAIAAIVFGFTLLIAGFFKPQLLVFFGIAWFAIMVSAAAVIASGIKQASRERAHEPAQRQGQRQGWFGRMEERWRKRYEGGDDT